MAVPYSVEYQGELAQAAALLREAAAATTQPTLKAYLEKRADGVPSATTTSRATWPGWSSTPPSSPPSAPTRPTRTCWFGYKAAFESFIGVRDEAETQKLARFAGRAAVAGGPAPDQPEWRNPKIGALAPLRVVDLVFSSGDGNSGVQTAAYNLPNDERVVAQKGSKRVMLKNTQEAKFETVLVPISKVALAPADQENISFDAFFTHILMHELVHGIGPQTITVDGRETTVREAAEGAPGAPRGGQGRHRWACGPCSSSWTRGSSTAPSSGRCTRPSSPRPSARSASASTRPTGGDRPSSSTTSSTAAASVVNPDGTFSVDHVEDQGRGHRPDRRAADPPGRGQLREGEGHPRPAGRHPARDAARPRPAEGRPRRHRAPLRDRRGADPPQLDEGQDPTVR